MRFPVPLLWEKLAKQAFSGVRRPAPRLRPHLLRCLRARLPETPEELIEFVFRHELLHIEIPPREVDGHWTSHPPEFWDALRALAPEGALAWSWAITVLGRCLKRGKKRECTFVKSNWKSFMRWGRPTMAQIDTMLNSGTLT